MHLNWVWLVLISIAGLWMISIFVVEVWFNLRAYNFLRQGVDSAIVENPDYEVFYTKNLSTPKARLMRWLGLWMTMKVPNNAIIPNAKLSNYLLVLQPRNDKSKFLARAGFTQNNVDALKDSLRQLIATNKAIENRTDQYGTYYQVIGRLMGANGVSLNVVTIWLRRNMDQQFQFITLIPIREVDL